jgi:hypothetical protein
MVDEQIQHELKFNKKRIENEVKNIEEALQDIKNMLADNQFGGSRLATWTDGYVARDVAKIASLLMRQGTLLEVADALEEQDALEDQNEN